MKRESKEYGGCKKSILFGIQAKMNIETFTLEEKSHLV